MEAIKQLIGQNLEKGQCFQNFFYALGLNGQYFQYEVSPNIKDWEIVGTDEIFIGTFIEVAPDEKSR